uniref:Bladder cancer-associated protein n=1 Tax=Plectus sambesii TaxID=2011161 RepID=A0A914X6F9_9BILA
MYCLQWLIPVLLIPKPWLHPSLLFEHAMFVWFYVLGFFMERRPCYICSLIFFAAVAFLCYSDRDACVFWPGCTTDKNGEQCEYISR